MKALITAYNEATKCTWCERDNEGVTIEFDGSFLKKGPLCFKCLQQAVKVHHKASQEPKGAAHG